MIAAQIPNKLAFNILAFVLLITSVSYSQTMQVEVVGGAVVTQGSTVSITAGTSIDFRITNQAFDCSKLKVKDVNINNPTDFDITPNNPKKNIRTSWCTWPWQAHRTYLDFEIENISPSCATTSTLVTIEVKNQPDFTFTVEVTSSPTLAVLGGSPSQDVFHNDVNTTDANGTYFGVVDEGNTVTRRFIVANIGSCDLDFTNATSNNPDFTINTPSGPLPINSIQPYWGAYLDVTFTAPNGGSGTQQAIISIFTNDTDYTPFYLVVEAEMFDENIPGPGGITSNFKLWLKSTRGIVKSGSTLTEWHDLGTNGKDATTVVGKEPTYLDTAADNINFNPVVKFENDGAGTEQYMYNNDAPISGFYNHDIFIVMIPDATMTSASGRNTIFAGIDSGNAGDITGVGFGDYSTKFANETLSYNQDVAAGGSYNGEAELNSTYSNAGIINVRNDATSSPTKQDILYNSNVLTTSNVSDVTFNNIVGSEYWIGKNFDLAGSLNGRVAEIFTFSERLSDTDRQKVESYLAIKYGITLGASTEAQKDYINSFDTTVWDATANTGFNYHVAGIGRDSISDLNQKQSKSINYANSVTIGLGGVFDTNSLNPNEFEKDGDFLVWGNNNGAFSGTNTNAITIASGVTTTLTRIDRKWKIVESNEGGDVETVYVSIPSAAFSGFAKTADEEYALIVADNDSFANANIIDVIPLRSDGGGSNLETWYNFDGEKYFTFGKLPKTSSNHAINIASGDYLVGDYLLNLGVDSFTISAWIKVAANASDRTIMAKGEKLQIRLNPTGNIEVYIDDAVTPKFTSNMDVDDGKWHHTTFIYDSGTILMYVDGVLDKSIQNIVHPTANYNHYAVGALYVDKDNVTNPLLGEIDEVYVWDIALSEEQVRYLMNQEIERFDIAGTDYIEGKILPQAATNNPTTTIAWSSLRVYYDFNSFYGSTIEGLTDDRYFLRLNYLGKTKTILDNQTTPLPYVSASNGAWGAATTWSNSSDQVIPNSLSLDGSTIIDWNIVEIGHDITSGDRDITLLGLKQTAGTLTIADPAVTTPIENNLGQALTVTNYLEIDGVIDLVGESQLIQIDGSIIDADSGGYIEKDQQGTANGFNYNYWSSSVGPITGNTATRGTGIASTNANSTIDGVLNDGTSSSAYTALTFDSTYTAADSDTPTTPRTLSTYWMHKFYGPQDDYYAWTPIDETSVLLPGEGFTMKGTSGAADIDTDFQNYVFKGLPNNGDITLALNKNVTAQNPTGDVERLIGNPYPSAIDAREFILDHLSETDGGNNTVNVINGAVYFWDHFGEENSHYLREYVGGYAAYNLIGGTAAISNDARINNNMTTGSKIPGQYIPVNQGFFVSTALDSHPDGNTPSANISTIAGGNIVFKNSQRVFVTENDPSSSFLRTSDKKKSNNKGKVVEDSPSIRIIYDSPKGYHRQLLLGVDDNASKDFDLGYDAFMVDVNQEDMYWDIDGGKFVIQGVDSLNDTQEFPLGLVVAESGVVSIRIEELKNIDSSVSIFVKDKETEESFKINNEIFNLNLETGVYNDRFSLVFQQEATVESSEAEVNHGLLVYYDSNVSKIKIVNTKDVDLNNLSIYNLAGQEISIHNIDASTNEIAINVSDGVYLLKFNSSSHGIINKKIIVR